MQQVFLKLSVAAVVSVISLTNSVPGTVLSENQAILLNINNIPFSVSVQEFSTKCSALLTKREDADPARITKVLRFSRKV